MTGKDATVGETHAWTTRHKDGTLVKGAKKKTAAAFGVRRNIWSYHTGLHHTAPDNLWRSHPAAFPLQLAEDHIISWTKPGAIVLDPMCGSGQTLLAALINDRHFIGIDRSGSIAGCRENVWLSTEIACGTSILRNGRSVRMTSRLHRRLVDVGVGPYSVYGPTSLFSKSRCKSCSG